MMAGDESNGSNSAKFKIKWVNNYLVDWQIIVTFVGFLAVLGSE